MFKMTDNEAINHSATTRKALLISKSSLSNNSYQTVVYISSQIKWLCYNIFCSFLFSLVYESRRTSSRQNLLVFGM